jgi:cytochrome c-type biogenesis protein CcsB
MNVILYNVALVLYVIGALHYLLYLVYQKDIVSRVAWWVVVAGFAAHTAAIVTRFTVSGYFPVTNLYESVSFFAWAIILFFIGYERRYGIKIMGVFIVPVALVMMASGTFLRKEIVGLVPALQSPWLFFHTTAAFLGYAAFGVTFAGGIMYILQERQLKGRAPGMFYYRLPPLEVVDRLNYHSLTIGFVFLTLGIITGAVWAEAAWGSYWSWDPKETWSLITWFIYAAILHARLTIGWRGRKAAWLAVIGFAAVLFTFLGVNLLLGGLHSYT